MKNYLVVLVLSLVSLIAAPLSRNAVAGPSAVSTDESSLKLLDSVDLTQAANGTGILDPRYCGRTDLVFDLAIAAKANWSGDALKQSHALFTLGRNMHDQKPNSVSVMVWENQTLFARMTSSTMSDTAQVLAPNLNIGAGQPFTLHARWTNNTITLDFNGTRAGEATMAGDFFWPSGRPYFVGLEDAAYTPWDGEITTATLRIFEPRIRANFARGNYAGYYLGSGPHDLALDFPGNQGKQMMSSLAITNINGQEMVANLTPRRVRPGRQIFALPNLPFGWYTAAATLTGGDARLTMTRPFVISPAAPLRDEAAVSPFGVAAEINLDPKSYDPALTDALMSRMAAMGVRWFRFWLVWDAVQQTPETFDWKALDDVILRCQKYGLTPYVCLVGGDQPWQSWESVEKSPYPLMSRECYMPRDLNQWTAYVTALARRYEGRVSNYQVWNEPDARNGFSPFLTEDYVKVLKTTSGALRAVDPKITVGLGGFAGGFSATGLAMMSHTGQNSAWGLGEFWALKPQPYYDVMDCHFYSVNAPGQSWDSRSVDATGVRKAMAGNGDGAKPLWNSETSFLTGEPGKIGGWGNVPLLSGQDQAARLVQLHVQSLAVGIAHTMWYSIRGDCGVLNTDFSPLPSYAAHLELARLLKGMKFELTADLGPTVRGYVFAGGHRQFTVLWTTAGSRSVTLGGTLGKATLIDIWGNASPLPETGQVPVGTIPLYVSSEGETPPALALVP